MEKTYTNEIKEAKIKIGQKIKMYREAAELTQEKLSDMIGLTPKFISNIECGSRFPSVDTLIKFSIAVNVPLDVITANINGISEREHISDILSRIENLSPRDKKITIATLETMLKAQES